MQLSLRGQLLFYFLSFCLMSILFSDPSLTEFHYFFTETVQRFLPHIAQATRAIVQVLRNFLGGFLIYIQPPEHGLFIFGKPLYQLKQFIVSFLLQTGGFRIRRSIGFQFFPAARRNNRSLPRKRG